MNEPTSVSKEQPPPPPQQQQQLDGVPEFLPHENQQQHPLLKLEVQQHVDADGSHPTSSAGAQTAVLGTPLSAAATGGGVVVVVGANMATDTTTSTTTVSDSCSVATHGDVSKFGLLLTTTTSATAEVIAPVVHDNTDGRIQMMPQHHHQQQQQQPCQPQHVVVVDKSAFYPSQKFATIQDLLSSMERYAHECGFRFAKSFTYM
jgi:hypothetical protein